MVTKTRVEILKDSIKEPSIFDDHYLPGSKACIERSRYITESFRKTEGEPMVIRRAKALANFLEKRSIFINEGELITGNVGRAPGYIPFFCEIMSAERIKDDIVKPGMLTDDEWKELEMHLGMSQSEADDTGWRGTNEGSKLAGRADLWSNWDLENNADFGTSGFTALPGGYRDIYYGSYDGMGTNGDYWSSTEGSSSNAWYRGLYYLYSDVYRHYRGKLNGFSVRCIRD